MLPYQQYHIYSPLYTCLEANTELFYPTGLLGLWAYHRQDTLCKALPTGIPDTDWSDYQLLIHPNQYDLPQRKICQP